MRYHEVVGSREGDSNVWLLRCLPQWVRYSVQPRYLASAKRQAIHSAGEDGCYRLQLERCRP